jgi:hypothetical protein
VQRNDATLSAVLSFLVVKEQLTSSEGACAVLYYWILNETPILWELRNEMCFGRISGTAQLKFQDKTHYLAQTPVTHRDSVTPHHIKLQ